MFFIFKNAHFFMKNKPLYAEIGIFRQILGGIADLGKGSTAGKQKKTKRGKKRGAPQVNRPKPDDIRHNGRRRRPAYNAGKWTYGEAG